MNSDQPLVCHSCGLALSTGGGRCPQCGAEQPELAAPAQPRGAIVGTPQRARVAPAPSGLRTALPIAASVVIVAVAGLVAWQFWLRRPAPAPAASAPVAAPVEPKPVLDAGTFNPSTILVKAKVRALAWNRDALLVSAEFSPVAAGKVDVEGGGRFEVVFGKPAGNKLGPGAPVATERLVVIVDAKGTRAEERQVEGKALAAGDPDCPFDDAWKNLVAAGVPAKAQLAMRYAMSESHGRAVWSAEVKDEPELGRTLDGRTCSILRR